MSQCQIVLIEDNPADVFLVQLALRENNVSCEMTLFNKRVFEKYHSGSSRLSIIRMAAISIMVSDVCTIYS
jgi:hypothetical protein